MSIWLVITIVGLAGMAFLALPGLARHGHSLHAGHTHLPALHGAHGHGAHVAHTHHAPTPGAHQDASASVGARRFWWILPGPHVIFSAAAFFGALGYLLTMVAKLPLAWVLVGAGAATLLFERLAVAPLWNLLLRLEGKPSTELNALVLQDAEAVTPFHNGRGMVSMEHDGRLVQFRAELVETQKALPVKVGDSLRVENVDADSERVYVSIRS